MQITALLSYTQQLKELLNLVFLLILCSQTYPDVAKASTHQYMYTLYRSPAPFYECLITVVIALLRTATALPKKSCITPQTLISLSLSGTQFVIFSVNGLIFVFSFPITLFFLLLPFILFIFNLLYFHFFSSFETSLYTFSFLLLLHLFSLSTFFLGKDPSYHTPVCLVFFCSLFLFPSVPFSSFLCFLFIMFLFFLFFCFLVVLFFIYYSCSLSICPYFSFLCFFSYHSIFYISFSVFVSVDFTYPSYFLDLLLYIFSFFAFCSSSFLYIVTIFSQSFSFSSNRLYVLFPS